MDDQYRHQQQSQLMPYRRVPDAYTLEMPSRRANRSWRMALLAYIFLLSSLGVGISTILLGIKPAPTEVYVQAATTTTAMVFEYGAEPLLAQSSFFKETLQSFKASNQTFIEADLSAMQLRVYDEGVVALEVPILSKGREGSWWETPAGLYQVERKTKNHLSSFGGVYQPWSLVFQGNFFIHGWPYYPDGTPVSSQYSGGCIRLGDADAKRVYDLVDVHTPVLVYEADDTADDFTYTIAPPEIDATSYLVADVHNGTILTARDADTVAPIASITKIMTALVAAEYINLDSSITVTENLIASTSVQDRLPAGTTLSAYSLLLPLLLESDNTAAQVLAAQRGTSQFVGYMNKKAAALGMQQTTFTDASGAHPGNTASVEDLLRLITYVVDNRSFVLDISSGTPVPTAYTVYNFGELSNFNTTPKLGGFIGGKVGKSTAAKETALVLYDMSVRGDRRIIAFIVLGAEDRHAAVQSLHRYVVEQYGS